MVVTWSSLSIRDDTAAYGRKTRRNPFFFLSVFTTSPRYKTIMHYDQSCNKTSFDYRRQQGYCGNTKEI
jgi:hypothetical protein